MRSCAFDTRYSVSSFRMSDAMQNRVDDLAKYQLFPLLPDGLNESIVSSYLEEQLDTYLAHLSRLLVGYIWQNEPFHLRPCSKSENCPAHLYGETNYGDSVDDEWFIVYLLYELTGAFPGLVAKIQDSDGEFLLIEAANSLPKWLKPETAENRVYIYNGELHIIPYLQTPADVTSLPAGTPSPLVAIECIRDAQTTTLANKKTLADIRNRIAQFPEKIKTMIHRAHCYIPASLAAILDDSPSLLAPMVRAFYHRHPSDLKVCVTFQRFRPGTRVMREVRFTKCLYAQLSQQTFTADKRSGWTMPAVSSSKFKAYELGMKLAHGAEIICSSCPTAAGDSTGQVAPPTGQRWQHFLSALSEKGFFRGEMEGSKLYCQLLDDASSFFSSSSQPIEGRGGGERIVAVLRRVSFDIERMREEEKQLGTADDDSWLNVSPDELDNMMQRATGLTATSNEFDSAAIADNMTAFVNKLSSHEGAEFPQPAADADVEFDPGSFMQNMEKMFEFSNSDDDSSSSGMSEYESDDEADNSLSPSVIGGARPTDAADATAATLADYMQQMDVELAATTIGQSFEKRSHDTEQQAAPTPPPRYKKMAKMAAATDSASSTRQPPKAAHDDDDDIDALDDDDFQPIDVDLNAVKNLLQSYNAQQGLAGPASNILSSMGVHMPQDSDTRPEDK